MTKRTRKMLFIASAAIFVAAVVPLLMYTAGYRLTSELKITKTGGLFITAPQVNSDIFVDNIFKKKTNFLQNNLFIQNLKTRSGTSSPTAANSSPFKFLLTKKQSPF